MNGQTAYSSAMRTFLFFSSTVALTLVVASAFAQGAPPASASATPVPPPSPPSLLPPTPSPPPPDPNAPTAPPAALPPIVPVPPAPPPQLPYAPSSPPFQVSPWSPPTPPEAKFDSDRVTTEGLPRDQRGGLTLDAAFGGSGDEDFAGGALILAPSIPLTDAVFLDLSLPFAIARGVAVGNPLVGVRGVVSLSDRAWLTPHGSLGLPVLNEDSQEVFYLAGPIVHGLWNLGAYSPNTVPIQAGLNVEGHIGSIVILRGQINLNVLIGYEDNDESEFSIEHAAELQLGHHIGGGLRLQGVALPTYENSELRFFDGDLYQFAIEPFFAFEGDLLFARAGLLLPIDELLGPPLVQSFALRLATGFRI
jgi:hypothetical protein